MTEASRSRTQAVAPLLAGEVLIEGRVLPASNAPFFGKVGSLECGTTTPRSASRCRAM